MVVIRFRWIGFLIVIAEILALVLQQTHLLLNFTQLLYDILFDVQAIGLDFDVDEVADDATRLGLVVV